MVWKALSSSVQVRSQENKNTFRGTKRRMPKMSTYRVEKFVEMEKHSHVVSIHTANKAIVLRFFQCANNALPHNRGKWPNISEVYLVLTVIVEIFVHVKISNSSVPQLSYATNFCTATVVCHALVYVHGFRMLLNFVLSAKSTKYTKLNRVRKYLRLQ